MWNSGANLEVLISQGTTGVQTEVKYSKRSFLRSYQGFPRLESHHKMRFRIKIEANAISYIKIHAKSDNLKMKLGQTFSIKKLKIFLWSPLWIFPDFGKFFKSAFCETLVLIWRLSSPRDQPGSRLRSNTHSDPSLGQIKFFKDWSPIIKWGSGSK